MANGVQASNQFERVLTFDGTGMWLNTGLQRTFIQNVLSLPAYPPTLSYRSGAILALDNSGEFAPYDSGAGAPLNVAVAILDDDRLPFSNNVGNLIVGSGTVVGDTTQAVIGSFRVKAEALFGILVNLSDVSTAMASMGASFDATSNSYSKF